MKIQDTKTALEIFEEASIKQAQAKEIGDYKTGNKNYAKVIEAASFLKKENAISNLGKYLTSPHVGVRLSAAFYWLSIDEKEAIKVLQAITKRSDIHAFTAEMTIEEWKKGNLQF